MQPSTEEGNTAEVIRELFERGSWRAVLSSITEPVLTAHGQGPMTAVGERPDVKHTPETLQMWLYRAMALWNLGLHAAAEIELKSFGSFDQVDFCLECYGDEDNNRRGSMVPFSLRLIRAELPARLGDHATALAELHALKHTCQTAIARLGAGLAEDGGPAVEGADGMAAIAAWRARLRRVQLGIGNCLLRQHEYELAMQVLSGVEVEGAEQAALNSGLARIALLQGDHETAAKRFNAAAAAGAPESSKRMNDGFLALTQGDYHTASAEFERAWSVSHSCVSYVFFVVLRRARMHLVECCRFLFVSLMIKPVPLALRREANHDCAAAGNNQAVCELYTGALAVAAEKLVEVHASDTLHENVIFNLCTLQVVPITFSTTFSITLVLLYTVDTHSAVVEFLHTLLLCIIAIAAGRAYRAFWPIFCICMLSFHSSHALFDLNLLSRFELQTSEAAGKKEELIPSIVAVATDAFDVACLKL